MFDKRLIEIDQGELVKRLKADSFDEQIKHVDEIDEDLKILIICDGKTFCQVESTFSGLRRDLERFRSPLDYSHI